MLWLSCWNSQSFTKGESMDYLLEFSNITKIFPGVIALDNVSLNVKPGEILAVCGENGAGKSTLIKVLSGIYPHGTYDGVMKMSGKELRFKNVADAKAAGVATIYQELELFRELTVAENIFIGEKNKNGIVNWNQRRVTAQKILDTMNVDISPEEKVKNLTTGKQQLVEIAKALSHECRILILDEPTSSLTDQEVAILFRLVRDLKAKGISCIYISHRLEEVFELCDRVSVIRDGKYIGTKETKDTNKEELISMMAGRELKELYPKVQFAVGDVGFAVKNISVIDPNDPGKYVVKDVSFQARRGEILGIAGLMGAGRTELASALFGAYKKDKAGEIVIEGKPVQINSPRQAIDHGLAYLSEDRKLYGLILGMSITDNTTLSNLKKIARKGILNKSLEILTAQKYKEELNIKTPSISVKASALSGGNQQKVIIGKWLHADPKVLILDEPTRGIDVGARFEIYKIINRLVEQGVIVIMISSDMPELIGMSDRILVMSQGRITADLQTKETSQEEILSYAIGGN